MTTLGDAVSAVREQLDEATTRAWSDGEIRRWVNEACADIARRTEYIDIDGSQAWTAATKEDNITLPIARVHRLEWWTDSDGTRVIPLEIRERFAMDAVWHGKPNDTQGQPAYATIRGVPPTLTVQLYPIPAEAGYLHVYYSGMPTPLATDGSDDTSDLGIPSGWDDLVVYYAQWCAERRDGQPGWQDSRTIYESKVQDMLARVAPFHNANPHITGDDAGWGIEYGYWG